MIKGLISFCMNLPPFVFVIFERTFPEIIETGMRIIPCKNINRAFIENCSVVGAFTWCNFCCCYNLPVLFIQIKVKNVIKVLSSLSLITFKEIKSIHISNTTRPTSWLRKIALLVPISTHDFS